MIWIACAVAAATLIPGQAPAEQEPITNYWVHLNKLLQAELERPIPRTDPKATIAPPRKRPFDAISGLRARDLVRAANEGAREARQRLRERPAAEIERQVQANIHFCLEYFPLLVQRPEDVEPLLHVMEDPRADPTFRIYLFQRIAPGLAPPSLFGDFLQDHLQRDHAAISRLFRGICTDLFAPAPPQAVAIGAWYAFEYDHLLRSLRADPAVAAIEAARGMALKATELRGENAPEISEATQDVFNRRAEFFSEMAQALAVHLDPVHNRPAEVRAQVRSTILRILSDIPLEDPAPVRAMLEAPVPLVAPVD